MHPVHETQRPVPEMDAGDTAHRDADTTALQVALLGLLTMLLLTCSAWLGSGH